MMKSLAAAALLLMASPALAGPESTTAAPNGAADQEASSDCGGPGMGHGMMGGEMGPGMMHGGGMGPMMHGGMGPGMMHKGKMAGMMGGAVVAHIAGRLAYIKAELQITDAQAPQWKAFADAVRDNANSLKTMGRPMMMPQEDETLPQRLARQKQWLATRAENYKKIADALSGLYAVLTPEQKEAADGIVIGPMGMPIGMM